MKKSTLDFIRENQLNYAEGRVVECIVRFSRDGYLRDLSYAEDEINALRARRVSAILNDFLAELRELDKGAFLEYQIVDKKPLVLVHGASQQSLHTLKENYAQRWGFSIHGEKEWHEKGLKFENREICTVGKSVVQGKADPQDNPITQPISEKMDENRGIRVPEQDAFQLTHYIVEEVAIKMNGEELVSPMDFDVVPTGAFKEDENQFILTLRAEVSDAKKNLEVSMLIKGFFSYYTKDAQFLRTLCIHNAPAILFPFVRAYVSNITSLGGLQPVMIPTYMFRGVDKSLLESLEGRFPNLDGLGTSATSEAPPTTKS